MGKFHFRKNNRLKEYDYSLPGYYFATICTKNMSHYFGQVTNAKMVLSEIGKSVENYWLDIPKHFPYVELDSFIIMPNHIHGIIIIDNVVNEDFRSQQTNKQSSLSSIIKGFKIGVTKWYRKNNSKESIWQKSFYDRVIRNERELYKIRKYILENPLKWEIEKSSSENIDI